MYGNVVERSVQILILESIHYNCSTFKQQLKRVSVVIEDRYVKFRLQIDNAGHY